MKESTYENFWNYFNPRPPRGGRLDQKERLADATKISIHVLREEDDGYSSLAWGFPADFNPRPPRGGRHAGDDGVVVVGKFQSTSSARRTTRTGKRPCNFCKNFNPRPPRGGRLLNFAYLYKYYPISIHVLREEDDKPTNQPNAKEPQFQSTSSARRTTVALQRYLHNTNISIHVLREEDDSGKREK